MSSAASIHMPGGAHAALLLHGLAGSPLEVRFIGRLLHRAGFSVSIPVIPGYSTGSAGATWQDWLASVEVIYGTLRKRYKTVSVAGLSVGANLALALAARPAGPLAIALWGTTLFYDGWAIPWSRWLFMPCYLLGIGRNYAYREQKPYGLKNERWRARVAEAMRTADASSAGPGRIPAQFLYQAMRLASAVRRNLKKVSADTLIMHSADDETASPQNAELVYREIDARHKRKILLGDSYHIITMDNERELVARETIRFFQQSIHNACPDEPIRLVSSSQAVRRLQRLRAQAPAAGALAVS